MPAAMAAVVADSLSQIHLSRVVVAFFCRLLIFHEISHRDGKSTPLFSESPSSFSIFSTIYYCIQVLL